MRHSESAHAKEIVERAIQILGGPERAFEIIDSELSETRRMWDQDINLIGRVLRAHLFVEHYLTAFLQSENPNLGSLESAKISFAAKVQLLNNKNAMLVDLMQGINHLNKIRNRLAHNLHMQIDGNDTRQFLKNKMFSAMLVRMNGFTENQNNHLWVLERFADYVGSMLKLSEFGRAIGEAYKEDLMIR